MNHDETNPNLQAWIEPELEARVVASALGEASAFEAAELERLIGEKPELAIFKRRIEAVHGLVGVAVRPDPAPLRLAPERRAKILATIGATAPRATAGATNTPVLIAPTARQKRRAQWIWGSSLAASLMFAAFFSFRYSIPHFGSTDKATTARFEMVEMPGVIDATGDDFRVRSPNSPETEKAIADVKLRRAEESTVASATFDRRERDETARQRALSARPPAAPPAAAVAEKRKADAYNVSRENGAAIPNVSFGAGGAQGGRASAGGARRDIPLLAPPVLLEIAPEKKEAFAGPKELSKIQAPGVAPRDEVLALSPFMVTGSADKGYAAGNTLSGYRLNTRLGDLAGSISVATKQQLVDSAALDLNDSFLSGGLVGTSGDPRTQAAGKDHTFGFIGGEMALNENAQKPVAAPEPQATQPAQPVSPRDEISTSKEAVSTFSLHVSDVSFRLAQAALARGETPDPERIRPEEFYNAFDYGDPSPTAADKVGCRIEQAAHPLLQQRNLVRIAMKVPATGRGAGQPLQLTVLLDTSGSMEREDRIVSVRRAFDVLASLLSANDRVTLIGFSRSPRLLAEQLPGNQALQLGNLAQHTPFTGGTNLEEVLKLSAELARKHHNPAAQNRIVLITDGAANLGDANPEQLAKMIEQLRQQGIAFDACGVGTDGLNDTILEALTRKGDGRYYLLDKPEDADTGFARQLAGAFRPAAQNVKVQVRFNPARVGRYRLIGFEQHRLREEDFRNDQVDAAELAAEEAAVALYQVEVLPQGEGELGEVSVRFRDTATNDMVERSWTISHEAQPRRFDRATPSIQLAGTAALLAEKLRGGDAANLITLSDLAPVVNSLRGHYANQARVRELIAMYDQMRRREGK